MYVVRVTGGESVALGERSRLVKPALKAVHDYEVSHGLDGSMDSRVGLRKLLAAVVASEPIVTPFEELAMDLAMAFEGVELTVDISEE